MIFFAEAQKKLCGVIAAWFVSGTIYAADIGNNERDWLFAKQIELYTYLLKSPEVADALRGKFKEGFHRFAFEYWLLCRTNQAVSSPRWRGYIRNILHREAKDGSHFKDPASLLPFFKDGKLIYSIGIVPVKGLATDDLSERSYRALVEGFQSSFSDFADAFPPDPIPSLAAILPPGIDPASDKAEVARSVASRRWRVLGRDTLPVRFQKNPIDAFRLLTTTAKLYYLPAFLRMYEKEPEIVPDLPGKLLEAIASVSEHSTELRSKMSDTQKLCLLSFFEDSFKTQTNGPVLIDGLRRSF